MNDVKWIKICTDIFDDEKILLIESLPEADSIIVIWFKLLCLAGKQNNSGVFMMNNKVAYTDEMLSTIFRRKLPIIRLALDTFEQFGMIERVEGVVTIPNWEKHQSLDQLEIAREQTRKRVAKHREKQKLLANEECNATVTLHVTQCNANRIEEDKIRLDKDNNNIKEKNIIKKEKEEKNINEQSLPSSSNSSNVKNNNLSFSEMIDNYTDDNDLKESLNAFIDMRKKIKKPLTNYAFKLILNKLNKLAIENKTKILILNQSIRNSWQDVYEIHDRNDVLKNKNNDEDEDEENKHEATQEEMDELLRIIGD